MLIKLEIIFQSINRSNNNNSNNSSNKKSCYNKDSNNPNNNNINDSVINNFELDLQKHPLELFYVKSSMFVEIS